jgi:hypothetical protein
LLLLQLLRELLLLMAGSCERPVPEAPHFSTELLHLWARITRTRKVC